MKVTVERAALLKSIGHVHRVVERRNTIPILANLLIRAEKGKLGAEGDRSRPRGDRDDPGRSVAGRLHHGAGAHDLRHRAQAARGVADRARFLRRPRLADDPRRALALLAADLAGERLSRSRRRRDDAQVLAAGEGSEAPDRQDAVRDLDRRDALLSQRHLSARRDQRQGAASCARSRPTGIASRRSSSMRRRAPKACRASSCRARPSAKCSA